MIAKPTLVASAISQYAPVEKATVERDSLQTSERFFVELDGVRSDDERGIINNVVHQVAGESGSVLEIDPYEYVMYEPVGKVVESTGRKHHIVGYNDQIVECILTTHKLGMQDQYGSVEQFDRDYVVRSEMDVEMFNVGVDN